MEEKKEEENKSTFSESCKPECSIRKATLKSLLVGQRLRHTVVCNWLVGWLVV